MWRIKRVVKCFSARFEQYQDAISFIEVMHKETYISKLVIGMSPSFLDLNVRDEIQGHLARTFVYSVMHRHQHAVVPTHVRAFPRELRACTRV